jgi:hypothetical protein
MTKAQTEHLQKLPTHNEIAWNLLPFYWENSSNTPLKLSNIAGVTGLDIKKVERLFEKRKLLFFIHNYTNGVDDAVAIVDEIKHNKPHYNLDEDHEYSRT